MLVMSPAIALGHLPQRKEICIHLVPVHNVHKSLPFNSKNWKQPRYPSTGERLNPVWHPWAMEHESAIKQRC